MKSSVRNFLRAEASKLQPVVTVGKAGINDAVIKEISEVLELRELVKINVLNNATLSSKDIIQELAKLLRAEPIQAIGNKVILYRKSHKKDIEHIILPK